MCQWVRSSQQQAQCLRLESQTVREICTLVGCYAAYSGSSLRVAYRGGFGVFKPLPRNSEGPPKLCQTQPDLRKLLKIAEFRMPTPQDVWKKGSKILKLPRFAIVLY